MDTNDIRSDFHVLIDQIENEQLLAKYYHLLVSATDNKEGKLYRCLSDEQKQQLLLAEEESEDPDNLISSKIQRKKHQKWL